MGEVYGREESLVTARPSYPCARLARLHQVEVRNGHDECTGGCTVDVKLRVLAAISSHGSAKTVEQRN